VVANYRLYQIGQRIALSFPRKFAYLIAVALSDIHYLFARHDKEAVRDNLRVIFPHKSEREIRRIRLRLFRNFAKYLVDFFCFSKLDRRFIQNHVRLMNLHYLDEALAREKGVISLSAHLGIWELGGAVIAQLGYPFWVVALPHKDKNVNDFFNFKRESKGVKVIPFGKAARQCLRVLKENEIVALVGDRDFAEKGIVVDFFGKKTYFPEGPGVFCVSTGAAIVPGFMLRNKDDSFTLRMEQPMNPESGGDKNDAIRKTILAYKPILEHFIREYPDQWFMFRRFWIA